jgi:hypothetical protein
MPIKEISNQNPGGTLFKELLAVPRSATRYDLPSLCQALLRREYDQLNDLTFMIGCESALSIHPDQPKSLTITRLIDHCEALGITGYLINEARRRHFTRDYPSLLKVDPNLLPPLPQSIKMRQKIFALLKKKFIAADLERLVNEYLSYAPRSNRPMLTDSSNQSTLASVPQAQILRQLILDAEDQQLTDLLFNLAQARNPRLHFAKSEANTSI